LLDGEDSKAFTKPWKHEADFRVEAGLEDYGTDRCEDNASFIDFNNKSTAKSTAKNQPAKKPAK